MLYFYLKAFHFIGFVSWFAGLFYMVRLFAYHAEADLRPEPERKHLIDQFRIMERRLWYAITVPAFWLTVIPGVWLIWARGYSDDFGHQGWLHIKLTLVAGLIWYHLAVGSLRRRLSVGEVPMSSPGFRAFNEVPTLFLVAIVGVVIFRFALWHALYMVLGLVVLLAGFGLVFWPKLRRRWGVPDGKRQDSQ